MIFKEGQIINMNGSGLFGKLIHWRNKLRWKDKYSWSHSAIIGKVEEDRVLVYEAISKGFVKSWYDKDYILKKIKDGRFVIGESKQPLKNVQKHLKEYLGRPYGFTDIFNITLYWVLGYKSFILSTNSKALICSEAVARALYDASDKKIDFVKEYGVSYDLIEPMHLWNSKQIRWHRRK